MSIPQRILHCTFLAVVVVGLINGIKAYGSPTAQSDPPFLQSPAVTSSVGGEPKLNYQHSNSVRTR